MSNNGSTLKTILDTKIIAISRGLGGEKLLFATTALYMGGVRAFEAAIVQGDEEACYERISLLKRLLPEDAVVGAGTVINNAQLERAVEAGAGFIISPNTSPAVILQTKRMGIVSIPGALTPSEIVEAHACGADIVKVFPAGTMGVEYFKQIKAPLSHIPMAAVGGLGFGNVKSFAEAGAVAYGISSSLYDAKLIEANDMEGITKAAQKYREILGMA